MSDLRKTLLILAEKKEIRYTITKIKKAKEEELQQIWNEVQKERLSETNELIANTFIEKLCDTLESKNIIDSGKETAFRLKDRKAFMINIKNMAGYFSSLIPYIGILEGGIILGKDAYEHSKNPRITEIFEDSEKQSFSNNNNKNEKTESSSEERKEQDFSKEQSFE